MTTLKEIIKKYCIQNIGIDYADMIIENHDFISAINEFNKLGYYVLEICWWNHKKINSKPDKISMGGPIDKNNKDYYWAETTIDSKVFEQNNLAKNLSEILDYYYCFIKSNKHNLYPSITLHIAYNISTSQSGQGDI